MSNRAEEIQKLMSRDCKSAADMTAGISNVGNGNMKKGFEELARFFFEEGKRTGKKKGAFGGIIATIAVAGIFTAIGHSIKEEKKHREKGDKIIQKLQEGIEESKSEENEICASTEKITETIIEE